MKNDDNGFHYEESNERILNKETRKKFRKMNVNTTFKKWKQLYPQENHW